MNYAEQNPTDRKNAWDAFDRIYCITVKGRDERQQRAENEFKAVGLADRVEFISADPHPYNSEQGIFESHQLCLRQGLAEGAEFILVFEDDVVFERLSNRHLEDCVAFLKNNQDWDTFFFGCLVKHSRKTSYPGIVKITYRSLAHAYVIRRMYAERVVAQPWHSIPFDAMLADLKGNFYAAFPSFAFQSNAESDNTRRHTLDRFRRWCGGLKRIQKANEWSHHHVGLLVALHLLGLAAVAALIWWWTA